MTKILAIDQSTSATKALLFEPDGSLLDSISTPHEQYYPQSGWVEHDPEDIWRDTVAVVRQAIRQGHEVVNLDALTYAANLENVASVAESPLYSFEHADIRDRAALDRVFATHRPDAVMHLAAESHVDRSIDGPGAFIETNVTGTYNLLEAARAYWTAAGRPELAEAVLRSS